MSFESAKPITPESFSNAFSFARRPSVRYPAAGAVRQSVNISDETRTKAALRNLKRPYAPRMSYDQRGIIGKEGPVGLFLRASA